MPFTQPGRPAGLAGAAGELHPYPSNRCRFGQASYFLEIVNRGIVPRWQAGINYSGNRMCRVFGGGSAAAHPQTRGRWLRLLGESPGSWVILGGRSPT